MAVEPAGPQTSCHVVLQCGSSSIQRCCTSCSHEAAQYKFGSGKLSKTCPQLGSATNLQLCGTHVKSGSGMSQYSAALL